MCVCVYMCACMCVWRSFGVTRLSSPTGRVQWHAVGNSGGSGTDRRPSVTARRPCVYQGQHGRGRGVRGHRQWADLCGRAGRSVQATHTHLPRLGTEL